MKKKYYKYLLIILLIFALGLFVIVYNKIINKDLVSEPIKLNMTDKPTETNTPLTEDNNF